MVSANKHNNPAWRSLAQRGLDGASEFADVAAQKLNAMADPRARLRRKQKWSLYLAVFFAVSCLFWVLVTLVMATWEIIPFWGLLIPGLIAAGAAAPATMLALRYRWLRKEPLPPPRPTARRRTPPLGSAARGAMVALTAAERSMFNLLGVIERSELLPVDELRDLVGAANSVAASMAATANDVVAMERAVASSPSSRSLIPTIHAFSTQLSRGVEQYNEMVGAAAQLVSTTNSPMARQQSRHQLVGATDRMLGWAQAFDELSRPGPLGRSA